MLDLPRIDPAAALPRCPAELAVGDWVAPRSAVALRFHRVLSINADPRSPAVAVLRPIRGLAGAAT